MQRSFSPPALRVAFLNAASECCWRVYRQLGFLCWHSFGKLVAYASAWSSLTAVAHPCAQNRRAEAGARFGLVVRSIMNWRMAVGFIVAPPLVPALMYLYLFLFASPQARTR